MISLGNEKRKKSKGGKKERDIWGIQCWFFGVPSQRYTSVPKVAFAFFCKRSSLSF
jgi:hypothetical protein